MDDGQYEGDYGCEEISQHCTACGKIWCGPCQRAMVKIGARKVVDGSLTKQDLACPVCRQPRQAKIGKEEFARRWSLVHKRAHDHHTAIAQWSLGCAYQAGHGTPRDLAQAAHLYTLAAAQGICPAMVNLGNMYRTGDGVIRDAVEAVRWYREAALLNHRIAQSNLGKAYWSASALASLSCPVVACATKSTLPGKHAGVDVAPYTTCT